MEFTFFGTSETGYQRYHNEDSYLCNPEEKAFLVVDGLGREASGEIASQEAIRGIEEVDFRAKPSPCRCQFGQLQDIQACQSDPLRERDGYDRCWSHR